MAYSSGSLRTPGEYGANDVPIVLHSLFVGQLDSCNELSYIIKM